MSKDGENGVSAAREPGLFNHKSLIPISLRLIDRILLIAMLILPLEVSKQRMRVILKAQVIVRKEVMPYG